MHGTDHARIKDDNGVKKKKIVYIYIQVYRPACIIYFLYEIVSGIFHRLKNFVKAGGGCGIHVRVRAAMAAKRRRK